MGAVQFLFAPQQQAVLEDWVQLMAAGTSRFDATAARMRCRRYRRRILDVSQQVAALHIAGAFSCTEIVDCIYNGLMRAGGAGAKSPDTFLMSKGHGCMIQT